MYLSKVKVLPYLLKIQKIVCVLCNAPVDDKWSLVALRFHIVHQYQEDFKVRGFICFRSEKDFHLRTFYNRFWMIQRTYSVSQWSGMEYFFFVLRSIQYPFSEGFNSTPSSRFRQIKRNGLFVSKYIALKMHFCLQGYAN